jgi:hypothetical protein
VFESRFRKSRQAGDAADHEHCRGSVEKGGGGFYGGLDVFGGRDALMIVASISSDQTDERKKGARDLQQGAAAVAILHVRGVRFDQQRPAIDVDQGVTLAPLDLLARIESARTAAFRGLDALAVDNGRAGTGRARPVVGRP